MTDTSAPVRRRSWFRAPGVIYFGIPFALLMTAEDLVNALRDADSVGSAILGTLLIDVPLNALIYALLGGHLFQWLVERFGFRMRGK